MAIRQKLELDIAGYRKNLKLAQQDLKRFSKAAEGTGKYLGDSFHKGARHAEMAWDRSGRRINRTLNGIKRVIGGVFAVETIRRFGTALVGVNNDLEQLRVRFAALTGSAAEADTVLGRIQQFAQSRGLAFSPLAQGVQTMTSFGVELRTVLDNLETVSSAAILSPDGMEQGFMRIGRALGQIAGNGRLAAEEMNQLSEAGLPAWKLLSQELGKSVGEIRKLTEEGKMAADVVVPALLEAIRKEYPTLIAEYSRSAEGLANRFKEVFRKGLTQVGSPTFAALRNDLASLSTSLDNLEQSGQLTHSLREVGRTLRDIYNVLVDIAKVLAPFTPTLLKIGAAFVAFRAIRAPITMAQGLITKLRAELAGLHAQIMAMDSTLGKLAANHGLEPSVASVAVEGAISAREHDLIQSQLDKTGKATARVNSAFGRATLTLGRFTRYIGNAARTLGSKFLTLIGGWSGAIALVVTAFIALNEKFDIFGKLMGETNRKLRDHRRELKNLIEDIEALDAATKGQKLYELTIKVSELQTDVDKMLGNMPDKIRYALNQAIADGTLDGLGDLMDKSFQAVQTHGGNPSLDPIGAANAGRLRRYGLSPSDLTPEIRAQIKAFADLQAIFTEASAAEGKLYSQMLGNYDTALSYYQTIVDNLDGIVSKTDEQIQQLNHAKAQIERINKIRSQSDDTTPTPPGDDPEKRTIMTLKELQHAMELLGVYDEMRGQLAEIHRIDEQIASAEADLAQLRSESPNDPRIADYEELLALLTEEHDRLSENYNKTYEQVELYKQLPDAARQLVDELGGMEELLTKGVSPDALQAFLPGVQQIQAYMRQLEATLADIRQNADLNLIDEDTATMMAAAAGETFRIQLVQFLETINLDALPETLRAYMQGLIRELAGEIGGTDKDDDLPKKVKDSAASIRSLVNAGRGLVGLARSLGKVSDVAADMATGLLDAGASMADLAETRKRLKDEKTSLSSTEGILAQLPGIVGIASGLGSVIGGLLSASKAEREEMKRLQQALRESAREIRKAIKETFKAPQVGSDIQRGALLEAQQTIRGLQGGGNAPGAAMALVQQLEDSGIAMFSGITETFQDVLKEIMNENVKAIARGDITAEQLTNRAVRELFSERFGDLDAALEELIKQQGEYSKTVGGAVEAFDFLTKYLGEDTPAAFKSFLSSLMSVEGIDEDLKPLLVEAMGLDLATEAGRLRVEELRKTIASDLQNYLGKLSPDEIERILDSFMHAEQAPGSSVADDWTTNVGQLRQITDAQGNEIVLVLKEIAHWTRQMATGGLQVPQMAMAPMVPHLTALQSPGKAAGTTVNMTVGSLAVGSQRDIPNLAEQLEKEIRKHLGSQFGRR